MKKISAFILSMVLIISLAACSQDNKTKENQNETDQKIEVLDEEDKDENSEEDKEIQDKQDSEKDVEEKDLVSSQGQGQKSQDITGQESKAEVVKLEEPVIETPQVENPQVEKPAEPKKPVVEVSADTAKNYIGKDVNSLVSAIGSPSSKDYGPSCLRENAEDGEWSYGSFTVYTIKEGNVETVYDVE